MEKLMVAVAGAVLCGASFAEQFSSTSYVTSGLIGQWDGIDNAGRGTHVSSASVWKDLVGSDDLALSSVTFGANYASFTSAKKSPYSTAIGSQKHTLNSGLTFEFYVKPTSTLGDMLSLQSDSTLSGFVFFYFNTGFRPADGSAAVIVQNELAEMSVAVEKEESSNQSIQRFYKNGAYVSGADFTLTTKTYSDLFVSLGVLRGLNSGRTSLGGSMYAVRLYDRTLTADEIAQNALVDKIRFNQAIRDITPRMDATGHLVVSAAVETLGGKFACALSAIVRDLGTGAETIRALGTATDSSVHEYSCDFTELPSSYELIIRESRELGDKTVDYDSAVLKNGTFYLISTKPTDLNGDVSEWITSSGLHRLPLDGDKIIIGQEPGTYALNITNAVTRTFNGWTGAGAANVVSETTIGAGSTLNITNTTAYGGNKSGSKASFVVDGGTLHIKVNAQDSMYGTDTLTIKNGGTFLRDGAKNQTHSVVMAGTSRIYLQDGTFTITPASGQAPYNTLHFSGGGTPAFIQTGGTASCGSLSFQQQSDNYYEISGGSMTLSGANGGIKHGNRSGSTKTCGTLRLRGSKFTFAAQDIGYAYSPSARTLLPTFFDYRIRSDADPGTKGVGFIDYTATAVKGAVRAIPDGGVAIVHTNLFPLIVQRSKNALTFANDFKDNMASYRFMPTGLFDIGVPSGLNYMIRADLKPEAELADGWTSEEGVSAGFVKLPRVVNPDKLQKANLRLKVEPKGTKTLASIKSDLEAMGFGPVTVDETAAYNLVVGLPKDRLAKGFADSKVLMDFTTVTGAKAMQNNTVTTNALIKAVSLDIRKPGLILMVD